MKDPSQPAHETIVEFEIVNLVFSGTEFDCKTTTGAEGSRRGRTTLVLNGRTVTLNQLDDYDDRLHRFEESAGNVVTATAVSAAHGNDDVNAIVAEITQLGFLLTLATNNAVAWSSCVTADRGGLRMPRERRDPPYKPRGFGSLAPRDGREFKTFIEATFPVYGQRQATYQLDRVAHARLDALSGSFLETRALAACVLVEFLANTYANQHNFEPPVPKKRFKEIHGTLRDQVRVVLKSLLPEVPDTDIDRMAAGVSRFNDPRLRDRLTFTCDALGTGVGKDDIGAVMETRQQLAHGMNLKGIDRADQWKAYRRVIHVVDRILLGLLDYKGPYTNVETQDRAVIAGSEGMT